MAEGGINAALNTKDENDSPEEHFTDTIKAACGLADPNAVWGMTQAAPELVHWLLKLGVKFNMSGYEMCIRDSPDSGKETPEVFFAFFL